MNNTGFIIKKNIFKILIKKVIKMYHSFRCWKFFNKIKEPSNSDILKNDTLF